MIADSPVRLCSTLTCTVMRSRYFPCGFIHKLAGRKRTARLPRVNGSRYHDALGVRGLELSQSAVGGRCRNAVWTEALGIAPMPQPITPISPPTICLTAGAPGDSLDYCSVRSRPQMVNGRRSLAGIGAIDGCRH
jgi:hypothetical protein